MNLRFLCPLLFQVELSRKQWEIWNLGGKQCATDIALYLNYIKGKYMSVMDNRTGGLLTLSFSQKEYDEEISAILKEGWEKETLGLEYLAV